MIITDTEAGDMLAEMQELTDRLLALASRAESAFSVSAAGQDVDRPTSAQRVLMAVAAGGCVPLADLVGGLAEAGRILAGEVPSYEEDDPVSTAEMLMDIAQGAIDDEDQVIRAAEIIAEVERIRIGMDDQS
jgi:hypothetical protein